MKDLGNKALIYLLCASLLPGIKEYTTVTAACVSALAAACLAGYLKSKRLFFALLLAYCAAALASPVFPFFLPVLLYDAAGAPVGSRASLACVLTVTLVSLRGQEPSVCFCLLVFSSVSYLIQYYSFQTDELLTKLHRLRDDSTESSLALKEKNEALTAKQDYELHLATLSERNRIAREIHDNVGHVLTRSLLQTGALEVLNRDEALTEPLRDLHESLDSAMTSIRNSVHDLHDEAINLKYALQDIANTAPLTVSLDYNVESEVPREIKYTFIAIVREAVNNTIRHSDADRIRIAVTEHPALYQLRVADNGTGKANGIDKAGGIGKANGIGLSNMEERVRALGGHIRFSEENGFQIFISVLK